MHVIVACLLVLVAMCIVLAVVYGFLWRDDASLVSAYEEFCKKYGYSSKHYEIGRASCRERV